MPCDRSETTDLLSFRPRRGGAVTVQRARCHRYVYVRGTGRPATKVYTCPHQCYCSARSLGCRIGTYLSAIDTSTSGGAEPKMLRLQCVVLVGERSKTPRSMSRLAEMIPQHDRTFWSAILRVRQVLHYLLSFWLVGNSRSARIYGGDRSTLNRPAHSSALAPDPVPAPPAKCAHRVTTPQQRQKNCSCRWTRLTPCSTS